MPITVDQAAEIARRHGLNLSDAQALSMLSDDEEHAERLARQFTPEQTPDELAAAVDSRLGRVR